VNVPNHESIELFLQEASENLQYLREYSGMLQEPQTKPEDLEKLYIAAHTLAGTSASYGYPQFSEVAAKMAHIFHYAMNATLTADMHGPLTEFISDAISVLEFDLLQISSSGAETVEDLAAFKQRYSFAFPAPPSEAGSGSDAEYGSAGDGRLPRMEEATLDAPSSVSYVDELPNDGEVPDEVLEFFIPEAEEHLQVVTECLLMLEANSKAEDINRLFRAMHTVKGSAAQVGLHRLSAVAHRVEDLIGELRDGHLHPNADIIDICLQSVDVLKKLLHRQWESDAEMRAAINPLLARIEELAPEEEVHETAVSSQDVATPEESRKQPITESGASAAPSAAQQVLPQAKSVRISLDRLDRMMNAVGELVINRTRMLGRLSELGN
jgi:chemotaxis protein histidine kinase CheA